MNNTSIATDFVAEIRANVDGWYSEPNTPETHAAFSARNGAIWKRIVASGNAVHDEVMRILRARD
jgi:hypothetical protein